MNLIIFSDIHYGPTALGVNASGVKKKLTELSLPLADKMIGEINKRKPSAAIYLGDFIEDVLDHDTDIKNLTFICNYFKSIKIPFFAVAGNHDLRTLSREETAKIMGYENPTFSVNLEGYHLVFLGLTAQTKISPEKGGISKTRKLSDEDMQWLEDDLKKNKLPALVFLHYGLAEDSMKGNFWFEHQSESALLQNRKEVKEILEKHTEVFAVFSGHQHWTKQLSQKGIDYYVCGSVTEDVGNQTPDGVWLEVDIDDRKIKVVEHHLSLKQTQNH